MSCLPLFSFSPSIAAAFRPLDDLSVSKSDEQCPSAPSIASKTINTPNSLYDKLSPVSVSHRRVDSFEWVITQSAPNTPPMLDGTGFRPYSPQPERLVSSAPLPVPNEHWSTRPKPMRGQQQRRYLDWWYSPSWSNGNGYALIPEVEEHDDRHDSILSSSSAGSPKSHTTKAETSTGSRSRPRAATLCPRDHDELRPSQELNALGIVLPDTPPPSPPTSKFFDTPQPYVGRKNDPRTTNRRLPKRVTFSPVIDEVILESCSDINEQQPSPWGSYLPSSFLVARPPLPRTASLPVIKAKTCVRPILRRSSNSETQPTRTTEMIHLSPSTEFRFTTTVDSPLPVQRLSVSQLTVSGVPGGDLGDAERAMASLLQATHKPSRGRSVSVLSHKSQICGHSV